MVCPHCRRVLEFLGERPSFCAYCGRALADPGPQATEAFVPATLTSDPNAPAPEAVPGVVGGYRLLRALGEGGMGTVYEAEDVSSGRRVALKLISPDFVTSRDAVERFRQEGRLAATVAHPRCVFVLAADEEAGWPYIVMELMPGTTLEDVVGRNGPLPPEEAVTRILEVIDGLQEVHRRGIIHRDVKPANCFVGPDGHVKVGDFGLSKSLAADVRLTRTGSFLGTPMFASPEQVRGEPLDRQTDVYSTAATLYFLLTGRAPFQTGDAAATLARIASDPAPSMRTLRPDLDPALDRVVLRGLERDRARRWRDLAEFRDALLPLRPGHVSRAPPGVRFAAYLIDYVILVIIGNLLAALFVLAGGVKWPRGPDLERGPLLGQLVGSLLWFLYFGLPEGAWGATIGKAFLRLRVRSARDNTPPGWLRIGLRTALFTLLLNLGTVVWIVVTRLTPLGPIREAVLDNFALALLLSFTPLMGTVAGIILMLLPMRARNGYRGLHEFPSGTQVVRLPAPPRRRPLAARPPVWTVLHPKGCPERLGAFTIRGALRWDEGATLLVGQDTVLGREAWLWLRPLAEPPLGEARRRMTRTTRLRWLACGRHGEWQWDAFLAPTGSPLPAVVRDGGRLSWPDVRPVLEQLTGELVEAYGEGTVPAALEPEQVWVQPDGAVQMADWPLGPAQKHAPEGPVAEKEQEGRALTFLGRAAALAVEGHPRPPGVEGPVCAPLPGHAAQLLDRLLRGPGVLVPSCERLQQALNETRDRPTEVSRLRRAAHLGLLAALLCVGLGCFMLPAGWIVEWTQSMEEYERLQRAEELRAGLEKTAWRDLTLSSLSPSPLPRLGALARFQADLSVLGRLDARLEEGRNWHRARLESFSWLTRQQAVLMERSFDEQRARFEKERARRQPQRSAARNFRLEAEEDLRAPPLGDWFEAYAFFWIFLLAWPGLWVVWAFLWRGGLSYRLAGVRLIRSSGRRASRLQCGWRALLVWAPVAGLLALSLWLEMGYWAAWRPGAADAWRHSLSTAVWYLALALLLAYAGLALWSPQRGPHDRLAGTYLVPR